jgi:hypothetical protein
MWGLLLELARPEFPPKKPVPVELARASERSISRRTWPTPWLFDFCPYSWENPITSIGLQERFGEICHAKVVLRLPLRDEISLELPESRGAGLTESTA